MPWTTHNTVQEVTQSTTIPSAVGGLNSRDTLLTMAPQDAIVMDNMLPGPYGVGVRKGTQKHTTGLGGEVQTILTWQDGADSKMFAAVATTNSIFDITATGAAGAASLAGLSNAQWRYVNFANSAGTHMVAVNGADDPLWYRTAGLSRLTLGDGIVSGTISGVNPNKFMSVTVHQRRLWFIQINTMFAWYLPTDQVYGVVNKYDLGPIFKKGGFLQGIYTWSKDVQGSGPQDQLAFVSSEGEVAVYTGDDVATSGHWGLAGVHYVSTPIGYNFGASVAGDLLLLTNHGVVSMNVASVPETAGLALQQQVSSKIPRVLNDLIFYNKDEYGWQIFQNPIEDVVLVNTPTTFDGIVQPAYNAETGGWGILRDLEARCWALFRQDAFFGTPDGDVFQAFIGNKDNVELDGSGGDPIEFDVQQAFNLLGVPGRSKYCSAIRPSFVCDAPPSLAVGVMLDYNVANVFGVLTVTDFSSALWDTSTWDSGLWGSSLAVYQAWVTVGGIGFSGSVRVRGSSTGELFWISTDWVFQPGGVMG